MVVILTIIGVMFLILIAWTWNSLGEIENKTKVISIIIGEGIVYILTFIIFNISKIGLNYSNPEIMIKIRRVLVIVFAIVNGYIILPVVFKKLNQINNDELDNIKAKRSILIVLIVTVLLSIFEVIYLGNMQKTMLDKYDIQMQNEINEI